MSLPPSETDSTDELVVVGRYRRARQGMERVLVVLALGAPCWLVPAGDGFELRVERAHEADARVQLERYERERRHWPPRPRAIGAFPRISPVGRLTALLWALATVGAYWLQLRQPGVWEERADLQSAAFFRHGQWWRPFTALFLHESAAHLLSNLAAGYFAFCAVLAVFGTGRGWLLIALSAVLGNVAAAAVHAGQGIESLGASTAIFAALGLLTGRGLRTAHAWIAPVGGGIALLGLYGAGGMDTDLAAHLFGFASGLAVGSALRR